MFAVLPEKITQQLVKCVWKLYADACFCFDSVDLNKYSAEKMEGLSLVRDGSTGHIVNGYVLNAVSVNGIPIMMEREKLVETQEDGTEKMLTTRYDIFEKQVRKIITLFWRGYWIVADRLYDDVKKFNLLIQLGFKFAIRMKTTRSVTILAVIQGQADLVGKKMKIGDIPVGYYEVTFTDLMQSCFLTIQHKKWCINAIRVLSNEDNPDIVRQYLKRWEIERIFKSGKQEYDFEKIGVQSKQKIDILIATVQLCIGMTAYTFNTIQGQSIERKVRWKITPTPQKAVISTLKFRRDMKIYLKQSSLTFNRNSIIGFMAKYMRKIRTMAYVQNRVTLDASITAQLRLGF